MFKTFAATSLAAAVASAAAWTSESVKSLTCDQLLSGLGSGENECDLMTCVGNLKTQEDLVNNAATLASCSPKFAVCGEAVAQASTTCK